MATRAHTVPRFYLSGFTDPESNGTPDPFVWLGLLTTGEVKRRSPKNISIVPGLYDGPEGLADPSKSIEAHLSKIEAAASSAIRKFVATEPIEGNDPPPEIWRFLAWQAARTPGWMDLMQQWVNDPPLGLESGVVEPPPEGYPESGDRTRPLLIEEPKTGERREVNTLEELETYRHRGWKWILQRDDHLEFLHLQAWHFQVQHFPRFSWVRLNTPDGEWFVTSDRVVTWLADGFADTPPAALRHPTTEVVAPLTRRTALIGRHETQRLEVTPREVNRFIASTASSWVAGPTRSVVEQALQDRAATLAH
ncbi:MAG: DUF4238 domain-containing protein [Betaproteobacteria bacterium]|nr:DUF4238 domain-containing protein [Betaproteobacteria bacterium]